MRRTKRAGAITMLMGAIVAAAMIFAPAASAKTVAAGPVAPPPSTVPIGGNGSTITNVQLNATTTTVLAVAPGAAIQVKATLTLGAGVNPGWVYWAGYGWVGAPTPAGCSSPFGLLGVGDTETTTFNLTAPATAGVYDVGVAFGPNPCPWAVPVPGPTIAKIVVTSYASVCALVQSDLADHPCISSSLCKRLTLAEKAEARGDLLVKANQLKAFNKQVNNLLAKGVLTPDEANLLLNLSYYL